MFLLSCQSRLSISWPCGEDEPLLAPLDDLNERPRQANYTSITKVILPLKVALYCSTPGELP
jgi:hypothetical protein